MTPIYEIKQLKHGNVTFFERVPRDTDALMDEAARFFVVIEHKEPTGRKNRNGTPEIATARMEINLPGITPRLAADAIPEMVEEAVKNIKQQIKQASTKRMLDESVAIARTNGRNLR